MQYFIPGPLPDHGRNLMRKLGYGELRKFDGQISYVRRAGQTDFPRFHAYIEDKDGGLQVNLHLDQKGATHEGSHAHAGEYDGPLVEQEMRVIVYNIDLMKQETQTSPPTPPIPQKKSSFWG